MLNTVIARQTLLISLKSWRYILGVSLLAYLFTFLCLFHTGSIITVLLSLLAGFTTLFYCWRLWLDERFFTLLYQHDMDMANFDRAIEQLWARKMPARSLEKRWQATGKLIYRAWICVALQWAGVGITLLTTQL